MNNKHPSLRAADGRVGAGSSRPVSRPRRRSNLPFNENLQRRAFHRLSGDCFVGKCALLATTFILALTLFTARPAYGQGGLEVKDAKVVVNFGEQVTFQARLEAPIPIKQASILFREVNEEVTRVEPLQVGENNTVSFLYDARQNIFPPFSVVLFWYQATLADDKTYTSGPLSFRYDDNRFPWRSTTSGLLTIHWYDGDDAFGQSALDAAGRGLTALNNIVTLSLEAPLEVYIYSNVGDLQGALQLGGEEWAGGHASPELGVVMVAVMPGPAQSIEMETAIPHELAHVMLYRSLGDGYERLPVWLSEGFASMAELYPNPDYAQALEIASRNDSLLRFVDLCDSFPPDTARAFLAYAQSQSFTTYLHNTYGTTGLMSLVSVYADGVSCELGTTRALSTPLAQLDARWRESVLGQNVTGVALRNLAPFALLMLLILFVPIYGAMNRLRERIQRDRTSGK